MTHAHPARRLLSIVGIAIMILLSLWFLKASKADSASANTGLSPLLQQYVHYVQEFSKRRRANTLFANTQSLFDGVQFNFVNVGRGNLTFVRRDLVLPGRIPVVLSRVYDSMSQGSGDFGPGWILSAAERIEVSSASATLFTESGTRIDFVSGGSGFVLARDYPSDYSQIRRIGADTLLVGLRNGTTKEFHQIGRVYGLARVTDRNGNQLRLTYGSEVLVRIENEAHFINLVRDAVGRVVAANDDAGRQVSYTYDDRGRLAAFVDAGGNVWNYAYTERNQLARAADPQGRNILAPTFQTDGRVVELELPSGNIRYQYNDATRTTIVTDRRMLTSRYRQNDEGITVNVLNPLGEETSITLDQARNAVQLSENGILTQSMAYDQQHRLASRRSVAAAGQITANYFYEHPTGQLTRVVYSNGRFRGFSYDQRGNIAAVTDDQGLQTFGYSVSGDLTVIGDSGFNSPLQLSYDATGLISSFSEGPGLTTGFQYDQRGRMTQALFSDGMATATTYDALGFRQNISYMAEDHVQYSYSSSGNLLRVQIANEDGTHGGQTIETDGEYRVRKQVLASGLVVTFDYDANGNLIAETHSSKTTRFEYDALDRLAAVVTLDGQRLEYVYAAGEPSLITQADLKTGAVPSRRHDTALTFASYGEVFATRTEASQLGSVRFSAALARFQLSGSDGSDIVDTFQDPTLLLRKLQLIGDGRPLPQRRGDFQAPTNLFFIPPEYATSNCCIECPLPPTPFCLYGCDPGCPPPPPEPLPTVSISGGNTVPLRASGATGPNFINLDASSASPPGGNWSWSTNSSKVTLQNIAGPVVTVTSQAASQTPRDVSVTVTYTTSGGSARATQLITVQRPTRLVNVGPDTTSSEAACTLSGGGTGCGVSRTFNYQVWDQFTGSSASPILFGGMPFWDSITTGSTNTCNVVATSTTCPGNTGPCGPSTSASGTFQEKLSICAAACRSSNGTCITGCTTSSSQVWNVNGFSLTSDTKSLSYQCNRILVNGN